MKKLIVLAVLFAAPALFAAERYACCSYDEIPQHGLYTNLSRVEFYAGVSLPKKDWKENGQTLQIGDTGWTAGIAFVRNILPWLTLGLDGNYAGLSKGDDFTTAEGNNVHYRSGVATALVAGRAYLFPKSMTRLYGTAGIGGSYFYTKEIQNGSGQKQTFDSTDLAWMLGAGIEFDLDETVVFGAEGRYNRTGLRSDVEKRFGHDNFKYWTLMLKLGVKF